MTVGRYRELTVKDQRHGLDPDEERELDKIRDSLQMARLASRPYPSCCEEAKRYRTVYLSVPDGARPRKATWRPVFIDLNEDPNDRGSAWYRAMPKAAFCTFCGAALPKMVRKADPPKPLCKIEDGGYYCSTCRERGQSCLCLPPSAAFEPAP